MSVRVYDYLTERTYTYICSLLCFHHVKFYVFIIMLIIAKRHELWCTVTDMRLSKYSIIIICFIIHVDIAFNVKLYMELRFKGLRNFKCVPMWQMLDKKCKNA